MTDRAMMDSQERPQPRMGFFTDTSVCIGCKACEVACKEWNHVPEDGLALTFPFGRHLFLPRSSLTVRMEVVGAVALVGRRRHFGYLLMERIGYEPDNERRMGHVERQPAEGQLLYPVAGAGEEGARPEITVASVPEGGERPREALR